MPGLVSWNDVPRPVLQAGPIDPVMRADIPGPLHADRYRRPARMLLAALVAGGALLLAWLVGWLVG